MADEKKCWICGRTGKELLEWCKYKREVACELIRDWMKETGNPFLDSDIDSVFYCPVCNYLLEAVPFKKGSLFEDVIDEHIRNHYKLSASLDYVEESNQAE